MMSAVRFEMLNIMGAFLCTLNHSLAVDLDWVSAITNA